MFPLLPIAAGLAQLAGSLAPTIAGWLGGPKAEEVATQVVEVAKTVTGQPDGDAALAAIQSDPNLSMQFQKAMMDSKVQLAQIAEDTEKAELASDTAQTASINQTIQIEAASNHWPTYSWRPFIGFCFGALSVVGGITSFIAYIGVIFFGVKSEVLSYLPAMIGSMAAVMATMAPVLGIASYFRGKMQADPNIPTDNRG